MGRGQDRPLAAVVCTGHLRHSCGAEHIRDHSGASAQYGADQELDQGVLPRGEIRLRFDARGTRGLAFAGLTRLARTWCRSCSTLRVYRRGVSGLAGGRGSSARRYSCGCRPLGRGRRDALAAILWQSSDQTAGKQHADSSAGAGSRSRGIDPSGIERRRSGRRPGGCPDIRRALGR